jgi:hypothetical protein
VVRYRLGRERCSLAFGTSGGLGFEQPSDECRRVATELTYRVRPLGGGVTGLDATQGTRALDVVRVGDEFLVSADPTRGAVALTPRP